MDLGTVLGSAWSSGISLYAVAAVLGIAGRMEWIDAPAFLEQPAAIGIALALLVVELVVDKIALLDSVWDAAHTVIRPAGAAIITAAAPDQTLPVPVLLALGVVLSLSSHSAKAQARLLINASPEPVSNVVASAVEDGVVGVVMTLAVAYPRVAAVVTVVLAVCSGLAAVLLFKATRAAYRKVRDRVARRSGRGGTTAPP